MKKLWKKLAVSTALALGALNAQAALTTTLYGDKDCFGIPAQAGAACGAGLSYTGLGGNFFFDYREVDDPAATDNWAADSRSFTIAISLPAGIIDAELDLFHAGAGTAGPATIFINGVAFGTFGGGTNDTALSTYDITSIISGLTSVNITVSPGDGWILDYAEVRVNASSVPEPATVGLVALAVLGLVSTSRRRNR